MCRQWVTISRDIASILLSAPTPRFGAPPPFPRAIPRPLPPHTTKGKRGVLRRHRYPFPALRVTARPLPTPPFHPVVSPPPTPSCTSLRRDIRPRPEIGSAP